VVQIVALACENPKASGYPVSHWSPRELATEAVKRGIVEKISPRSIGRFLKRSDLIAPQIAGWFPDIGDRTSAYAQLKQTDAIALLLNQSFQ
jgi:hypothetical protein